ncbi:hypothetical protein MSG28_001878 [Choristoneura fumiferana]|uniref:Uncharacterized protein n=1 Tax=Choristoneura fumiferana TaxID=7141 RepID=A0ACC0JTD4_CHOFU|nr:hypothetical protein MSG28_001878 [Choristoneura fumiferana]
MPNDDGKGTASNETPSHGMLNMAEAVAKFNGEDVTYSSSKWAQDIEDNADIFGWTAQQKLKIATRWRRSLTVRCIWTKNGIQSQGKQEGVKKVLDTIYIPAGRRSTTVDLPTLCTDNNNLAENVTVCDDEPPTVRVRKWPTEHWLHTSVDVIRRGDYEAYHASFVFTYWCPY